MNQPTPHGTAITAHALTKRYGSRTAVAALDLEVPAGAVAGFVGPNGAGKTTTMAMLLGLVRPTSGSGTVLGQSLTQPTRFLNRVGALIETPAFYPGLTGKENLRVCAAAAGHDGGDIDALLELVGLADRAHDRFRGYSLGMKQRLGIAAAMLGDPELLVLDEPINGLDPAGIHEMRALIGRLADGRRTLLISSHVLSELDQVCDWLVVIDHGRTLFQGEPATFGGDAATRVVAMPEHGTDLDRLRTLIDRGGHAVDRAGDELVVACNGTPPRELAASVNRAAAEQGIVLAELHVARTSLEDRYLAMTSQGEDR